MCVALVSSFFPPCVGGIESHVAALADQIVASDALARVVCLDRCEGQESATLPALATAAPGIEVRRVPPLSGRNARSWRLALQDADVVHFHGFSRPLFLRTLASTPRKAPIVLTPHGALTYLDESDVLRRALKRGFDATVGPILRRRVKRIMALTSDEAAGIEQRYRFPSDRISVIPNPLPSVPDSIRGVAPAGKNFLVLSRLAPRKNVQDVVRALDLDPTLADCIIAGPDDGSEAAVRELAARLQPGRVQLVGPLSGAAKFEALRHAIALVLPSAWEQLSIAALESIAVGTPVVASDAAASGLPREAVVTFPTGSARGLVQALHEAVQRNDELRRAARSAAAAWCSEQEWGSEILSTYASVLSA